MRFNPWLAGLSRSQTLAQVATLFSPYDFNPLGFDPLRKVLEAHVDFALLRTQPGPELLIAATDVRTGRPRLFRRRELIVECVLASACLPTLHHAVSVDGRAYWDGGFSANPDLVTLARESPVADTLIVKLNPMIVESLPTSAREITARINHITFNQPMLRDVEVIEAARRNAPRWLRPRHAGDRRLVRHRFHLIEAGRVTGALSPESKVKPDLELLLHLCAAGQTEADKWLARHGRAVGATSSVDLAQHFLAARGGATSLRASSRPTPEAAA